MTKTMTGWAPASLALSVLLTACAGPTLGTAGPMQGERLTPEADVLVLPTADFIDENGLRAENSGSTATSQWRVMLSGRGFRAETAPSETLEAGLNLAREGGFDYMLESRITGWHDATREWKEQPDRVEMEARIYRVADGAVVAWGFDEEVGATSDDKVELAHRLLSRLIRRMVSQFLEGEELTEAPPED